MAGLVSAKKRCSAGRVCAAFRRQGCSRTVLVPVIAGWKRRARTWSLRGRHCASRRSDSGRFRRATEQFCLPNTGDASDRNGASRLALACAARLLPSGQVPTGTKLLREVPGGTAGRSWSLLGQYPNAGGSQCALPRFYGMINLGIRCWPNFGGRSWQVVESMCSKRRRDRAQS